MFTSPAAADLMTRSEHALDRALLVDDRLRKTMSVEDQDWLVLMTDELTDAIVYHERAQRNAILHELVTRFEPFAPGIADVARRLVEEADGTGADA